MHKQNVDQLLDRVVPSVGPSRPEPDGYTVSLPEPSEAEMPELQPPAIELENPGAESMSESPPSRRYPVREHRPPRGFSFFSLTQFVKCETTHRTSHVLHYDELNSLVELNATRSHFKNTHTHTLAV